MEDKETRAILPSWFNSVKGEKGTQNYSEEGVQENDDELDIASSIQNGRLALLREALVKAKRVCKKLNSSYSSSSSSSRQDLRTLHSELIAKLQTAFNSRQRNGQLDLASFHAVINDVDLVDSLPLEISDALFRLLDFNDSGGVDRSELLVNLSILYYI